MVNMRSVRCLSMLMMLVVSSTITAGRYQHDEYQWDEVNTADKINSKVNEMFPSFWSFFGITDAGTREDVAAIKDLLLSRIIDNPDFYAYKGINGVTVKLYSDTKTPQAIRAGVLEYI